MTDNLTDPRPAATEAAMIDPTTLAAKAYQEGRASAFNDETRADALHEEVMVQVRELESRLNAAAAPPSGQVCVDRDDLELAIEWMDQTDSPWSGEAFQDTWAASLVARDQLKDALHESYVTEGAA